MPPVQDETASMESSEVGEGGSKPSELQETGAEELKPLSAEAVKEWLKEIGTARKREEKFMEKAAKVVKIYEAEEDCENQFNILFSNTETLSPALYSTVPVPVVRRRFKDEDPVALAGADVLKRTIESLLDTGDAEYATFDELLRAATLDALVPGRGVTRFQYHAEPDEAGNYYECVVGKEVPWDRFIHGYGKTWKQVQWVAYEHRMTKDDLIEEFGEDSVNKAEFKSSDSGSEQSGGIQIIDTEAKGTELTTVYELWDKIERKVHFFTEAKDSPGIKSVEDPLKLSGFFNCPRPLSFTNRVSGMVPIPPYKMYEDQARELNNVTARIQGIIKMMKVRGIYDATLDSLKNMLSAEEGSMEPIENAAALYGQNASGLDAAFWLMPIDKLVPVLQQLYNQRQQVKQVIYEITGISDILRGSSAASETATAQNIKNQWGTLRLKNLQREVARYARECMRLIGEVAAEQFSVDTLRALTNLNYPTNADKQQLQQQLQTQQQQFMEQQQMQPPMTQPGQPPAPPPQPPQPTPEQQKMLQTPSWEDVMGMLHNEVLRNYKIDIEANSTIDPENSDDQKNISDLLNGLSQVMNGMAPLIQSGQMPFEILKNLLLVVARRYTFGPEIEEQLKGMQAPPPPGPPPPDPAKVQEAEMRQREHQMKMQADQQKQQADTEMQQLKMQTEQAKAQAEMAKIQAETEQMQMEMQLKQEEHQMKLVEMQQKQEAATIQHRQKLEGLLADRLTKKKETQGE